MGLFRIRDQPSKKTEDIVEQHLEFAIGSDEKRLVCRICSDGLSIWFDFGPKGCRCIPRHSVSRLMEMCVSGDDRERSIGECFSRFSSGREVLLELAMMFAGSINVARLEAVLAGSPDPVAKLSELIGGAGYGLRVIGLDRLYETPSVDFPTVFVIGYPGHGSVRLACCLPVSG